ncbi:MAG: hypothetical protein ACREJM_04845 [Candidatus Saccharimonadales bacterium]
MPYLPNRKPHTHKEIAERAGHLSMASMAFRNRVSLISFWGAILARGVVAKQGAWYAARLSKAPQKSSSAGVLATAAFIFAAPTLAGCGLSDGAGALMVDPARYDAYNCKDLVSQWNGLVTREAKLRNLIDKADEGGGGVVIGALAYRGDYETVLEQKKLLQRAAAERKCQMAPASPTFTSDQTIR